MAEEMVMNEGALDIPAEWERLELEGFSGTLLVVGAPDAGKSTFARYLFRRLRADGRRVAFLDGDPGQSALGPPTTFTLAFDLDVGESLSLGPGWRRYFVGATSPRGHMLPTLVGAARLARAAQADGAQAVVYDTSGLVDPSQGGLALKNAKVDLLRPAALFALQEEQELEPLLLPLRRSGRVRVFDLRPSVGVRRRDHAKRRAFRAAQFERYFAAARPLDVEWTRLAVFPLPVFRLKRLVALEDAEGFTLGLGIVREVDRRARRVSLLTPLRSLEGVNAVRLGDVLLEVGSFRDDVIW